VVPTNVQPADLANVLKMIALPRTLMIVAVKMARNPRGVATRLETRYAILNGAIDQVIAVGWQGPPSMPSPTGSTDLSVLCFLRLAGSLV